MNVMRRRYPKLISLRHAAQTPPRPDVGVDLIRALHWSSALEDPHLLPASHAEEAFPPEGDAGLHFES